MIRRAAGRAYRFASAYADRLRLGGLYVASGTEEFERHLNEAAQWLARAQDAGSNRGISYGADFGASFLESYPETTGYIIPTFLALARHYDDASWHRRALAAAEWECAVQMPEGAVMGGLYNATPSPAVFNTGMVLLGWAALLRDTLRGAGYNATRDAFTQSSARACDWLVSVQDPDGGWRRENSRFANREWTIYNVKAAWGLSEAGYVLGHQPAIDAAIRNGELCLANQRANGWFANNCLLDAERPLLHTIAYVMQGLIGLGRLTQRMDFIDAAQRTADAVIATMDDTGIIPGCLDRDWAPAAEWTCLTGSAQTAVVCGLLYRMRPNPRYLDALRRLNRYLMRHHDVQNRNPALRGGVPGSWPVWGGYGRFRILNWATNFFVESLLLEREIEASRPGWQRLGRVGTPGLPAALSQPES